MHKASLVATSGLNNEIFNLNSPLNRDNSLLPFALLRQKFATADIELNTHDLNQDTQILFELHLDAQAVSKNTKNSYAVLFETSLIHPANADQDRLRDYQIVFTWDDLKVDGDKYKKINFPNFFRSSEMSGYAQRHKLCVMIAGNKSMRRKDARELYSERIRAIKWFEAHAPADFDLYGTDWDLPTKKSGFTGKLLSKAEKLVAPIMGPTERPSYRGKVLEKASVLRHARFSICYENVQGLPGYITEKIFDCFAHNCVPIYWGAPNVTKYIPSACFINKQDFPNLSDLYKYIASMPESEYLDYQRAIVSFIESDQSRQFHLSSFVDTIYEAICSHVHQ
jgi:alpha(1,3/1,4) fucosyltransferase